MSISLIVAMATNGVIGTNNEMPWHLSSDLKDFKQKTLGKSVICGRKTFESVGRLPGRPNIVVSRSWLAPDAPDADPKQRVYSAASLEKALALAEQLHGDGITQSDEIMVIGGGEIYALALPLADKLYITRVNAEVHGDTTFPEFNDEQWQLESNTAHAADAKNEFSFHWQIYTRKS